MIQYLEKKHGHRLAFVPTAKDTKYSGLGLIHEGEEYMIGFNFQNLTDDGDGINFTFSSTYDFGIYLDSALIYLQAVSEIDEENKSLYEKWIAELLNIQKDVIQLNTLLPAYSAFYGEEEN